MDENTLIDGDIFGGLLPLCHVSASQEDHLRRCPFAPEPYDAGPESSDSDSDAIPVESTVIMMVSPPDSLEFRDNNSAASNDVFQTPPEDSNMLSSQEHPPPPPAPTDGRKQEGSDADMAVDGGSQTVVVDVDDSGAVTVELGLDSELGFSEVQEETQRNNNNSQSESLGFRVSSWEQEQEQEEEEEEEEGPYEPPFKKSKIPTRNSAESAAGSDSRSRQNVEFNGGGDAEFGEETEANGVVLEETNAEGVSKDGLTTNEGVAGSNGPDREFVESAAMADEHGKWQRRRRLPPNWIGGAEMEENRNDNEVEKAQSKSSYSILYALKLVKKLGDGDDDDDDDDRVPRYGFVEICKQKGIIFPHPSWWPEGDFKLTDDNHNDHH